MEVNENISSVNHSATSDEYLVVLRLSIAVICILSIIGAFLIIITYFAFRDVRTIARQLLVNLSIADLITALANLIGLLVNFEKYLNNNVIPKHEQSKGMEIFCIIQAFIAQLGTDVSILWTIVIALYMLIIVVFKKIDLAAKLVPAYYIICWGIPLIMMIWFAVVGYLGFEPDTTPGWCSIRSALTSTHGNVTVESIVVYPVTIGYTGYVFFAFLVLPVLYIIIRCHVKILIRRANGHLSLQLHSLSTSTDLKLIFVPLIFMIIRIWGIVVDIFTFYLSDDVKHRFEVSIIGALLILIKIFYLLPHSEVHKSISIHSGCGDSSQGFVNCILFIVFTKTIRVRLWSLFKTFILCRFCRPSDSGTVMVSITEETAGLLTSESKYTGYESIYDPPSNMSRSNSVRSTRSCYETAGTGIETK